MSVKCFQAKVVCKTPEQREYLWLTHRLFHEALARVLPYLARMRRGALGPDLQKVYYAIRGNQNAPEKLEPLTTTDKWGDTKHVGSGDPRNAWANVCDRQNRAGKVLFNRNELPFAFPSEFMRKVFETAMFRMRSHDGACKKWSEDFKQWQRQRMKWEGAHPEYMAVKPLFDAFELREGQLRGSRDRWLRRINFFTTEHPELTSWKGGPAKSVVPLTEQERQGCRRPGDHFRIFWKKNPDLEELDDLDAEWREKHSRFRRKPTWTQPHLPNHPCWYSFKRKNTYANLDLRGQTIELMVLASAQPERHYKKWLLRPHQWITYDYRADSRMAERLSPAAIPVKIGKTLYDWTYRDPILREQRPACLQGIKLVYRDKEPYLYFSVDILDKPSVAINRGRVPDGTAVMCVDFGMRRFATCSVSVHQQGLPPQKKAIFPLRLGPLSTEAIGRHEQTIRKRTKRMFKARKPGEGPRHTPRGGTTFAAFRDHKENMKEALYKEGVNLILKAAQRHGVKVIVVEDLKWTRPKREQLPRRNRQRMLWAIRRTVHFLQMASKVHGIIVEEVNPSYSSLLCHKCGHPGARFRIPKAKAWKRTHEGESPLRKPLLAQIGGLFVCPDCKNTIDADVNAAMNLQAIYARNFERPKGVKGKQYWRGKPLDWRTVETCCEKLLLEVFPKKKDLVEQTPW